MLPLFSEVSDELRTVELELERVLISRNALLTQSATHLFRAGGKRLRPAFALLSAKCWVGDVTSVIPLAVALELIHGATLIHDDVVDDSYTRRGMPTVRAIWGDRVSTHTGDYLLAKAMILVSGYRNSVIISDLARTCVKMCEGEMIQMRGAYQSDLRNYLYRIRCKTGYLIEASCKLGAVAIGAPRSFYHSLRRFGHYLGMAFQITDDVLDMVADESKLGKPVGSDLRQGLVTLPAIHVLRQDRKETVRLRQIVETRMKTDEEVHEAIDLIHRLGGIKYARRIAGAYLDKAIRELRRLPDTPASRSLREIAEFIQVRHF